MIRKTPKNDLRVLLIEITQKCNAACDHCGSRCDINSEETLSSEQIIDAMLDISAGIGTDVMVNITGGEPLMRDDLFDIMAQISAMGFDWGMVTNGTLITDSVIEEMKATNLKTITVSIDGVGKTHEDLRHLPGSYEKILANLKKLKDAAFLDCIQVTFTQNKKNYKDFPELYRRLSEIGIDSIRTSFIDPIGRALDHEELMMSAEEMQYGIDFANHANASKGLPVEWGCCHYLGDKLNKRKFFCFAGIHAASILYNGDIFVCPNVPRRKELIMGNILTDSFTEAWNNRFEYYRNRPQPDKCRDCRHYDECKGDSLHTFDFEKNEPGFCYRDIFELTTEKYEKWMRENYTSVDITRISDKDDAPIIYIEPDAYEEIKTFFHMERRHPLSLYEQQMGLVGFKAGSTYVIRYVFMANINSLSGDMATLTKTTLKDSQNATDIIKRNIKLSDDANLMGSDELTFLGFIHSHPKQKDLCYSIGDELLHKMLYRKFGDYIGILINPPLGLIGAYVGNRKIIQGDLRLLERK